MVSSCDPFKDCLWPPTRDQKGHLIWITEEYSNQHKLILSSFCPSRITWFKKWRTMVAPMSWSQRISDYTFFIPKQGLKPAFAVGFAGKATEVHLTHPFLQRNLSANSQLRMWHMYLHIFTLKLTARAPENWWFLIFTDNFLLGWSIFRGYLNLREYTYMIKDKSNSKIQRCSASPYALQRKKSNKFFTENSHQISLIARPPGARFLLDTNYRDPEGVGTCRFLSQKFRGLPYTPKV